MPTLAEAKAHIRIDHDYEDSYISTLIAVAYSHVQNYTNRAIIQSIEILKLDTFQDKITIPETPVISLSSIAYNDEDGVLQAFTDYYLNNRCLYATIEAADGFSFPTTDGTPENVVITYETGYTVIPTPIEQACLLIIGSLYEQRENHIIGVQINEIPVSAEYLLNAYRVLGL